MQALTSLHSCKQTGLLVLVGVDCCRASPKKWPLYSDKIESVWPQLPINLQYVLGFCWIFFVLWNTRCSTNVKSVVSYVNAIS